MNIKLAYDFDLSAYKSLFPEIELFDWDNHRREHIDLMVFPGGEDVSMDFYASRDSIEEFKDVVHSDRIRDDYEINIFDACFDGRLNVGKLLGVCRGLQLFNVMFDGKLFPDLERLGIAHDRVHRIRHKAKSNLGFIETVNSLHHQGIREIGKYSRHGGRSNPTIIATDMNGYVPEIVTWENDRVLAVQFHPEYYWEANPDKDEFRKFCYSWVNGKTTILKLKD